MGTSDTVRQAERILVVEDNPTKAADYRALIDRNRDGILVIDHQGALRYANPAARNLLGPECVPPKAPPLRMPMSSDGVVEIEIARAHTPPATVEVRTQDIEWEGLDARLVTLHDVTVRELAIDELELTRRTQLRAKDELLSHVSHELRTPLSVIDQFVTLLLDGLAGSITDTQREYLDIAHRNTGQLRNMVEDLLAATHTQSGKLPLEPCELSLLPVLRDAEEALRQSVAEKGLTFKLEAAPDLPAAYADPRRVRQIVLNLVGNAIKFTPAGGQIRVSASLIHVEPRTRTGEGRTPGSAVRGSLAEIQISVSDTGCGIRASDRERIFDQFYQVASTRDQNRTGLGLGLFICRGLVTRQGGRIWVDSEVGRGTTLSFTLPLFHPDVVFGQAIQRRLASAGKERGLLRVFLFALDADAIGKASAVADNGEAVTINDIWEALARKTGEIRLETAAVGNEFIVLAPVNTTADTALPETLRRLLKDVLFQIAPAAVADFSCGVATQTVEAAGATEILAAARNAQVHEHGRITGKRIVIVDEESSARAMLREMLGGLGFAKVGEATGGEELLAILEKDVPDLILLDLHMPGMNGYEVIGRLKEHGRTADIPVLMVSGYKTEREELRRKSPKTVIFALAKPVDPYVLASYVSYLL